MRGVRLMNRINLRFLILGVIVVSLAASAFAYAENLPAGVLPTPVKSEISVSVNSSTYAPGDRIQIKIEAKSAGFLYLYDIDPAGTVTLLYPNAYQPNSQVPAGTIHLPGKGYHLTVDEPEGTETIVAILSRAPIDQLSPSSKVPFRSLDMKPQALTSKLSVALANSKWTSAWAQFTVYQPKGIVHIESEPAGAKIRVNGHDLGRSPKDLVLPAGEAAITLIKNGYEPFTETVIVHDQGMIDIDARLQKAATLTGGYGVSAPIFIGLDVGTDSIGMEIGIAHTIGIATAIRFTGDAAPVPGETYNYGPEIDMDLRLHVHLTERLSVLLGGGIGLQNTALAPAVTSAVTPLAITIQPDIETELFPSFVLGLEVNLGHASVLVGYHLRRGFIFGIELLFAR